MDPEPACVSLSRSVELNSQVTCRLSPGRKRRPCAPERFIVI